MLNKICVYLSLHFILLIAISSDAAAQNIMFDGSSDRTGLSDVHVREGSKCDICHPPTVDVENSRIFLKSDLCISCHEEIPLRLPRAGMRSSGASICDHPIKFSNLDFDSWKINQTIINDGRNFWVSGSTGSLPLFGLSRRSALVECATCHDPHGTSGFKKLQRIDNRGSKLCMVCHLIF